MLAIKNLPLLVLVTGPPGCGKTTLAMQLSEALNLPLVSIDQVKASVGSPWPRPSPPTTAQGTTTE